MPKYLAHCNYATDGIKGLLKDGGTKRRAVVEKMIQSLGGKLESYYYAFGDTDLYVIADMPEHASMVAISLMVGATGTVVVKTTVLLSPEELDEAAKKSPTYSPPGQ